MQEGVALLERLLLVRSIVVDDDVRVLDAARVFPAGILGLDDAAHAVHAAVLRVRRVIVPRPSEAARLADTAAAALFGASGSGGPGRSGRVEDVHRASVLPI